MRLTRVFQRVAVVAFICIGVLNFGVGAAQASVDLAIDSDLTRAEVGLIETSAISVQQDPICHAYSADQCVDALAQFVARYELDSPDEILTLTRACNRNMNGTCAKAACTFAGRYNCDSLNEAVEIANACSNNLSGTCVQSTCTRMGTFGCDSLIEVVAVAKACAGPYLKVK